jgi:hypothetical protein
VGDRRAGVFLREVVAFDAVVVAGVAVGLVADVGFGLPVLEGFRAVEGFRVVEGFARDVVDAAADVLACRSSSRTRRFSASTSSLLASPARAICFRTSLPIISRSRSRFRRDQLTRSLASPATWSRRISPCLARLRAICSAFWGERTSRPASTYLRTVSVIATWGLPSVRSSEG